MKITLKKVISILLCTATCFVLSSCSYKPSPYSEGFADGVEEIASQASYKYSRIYYEHKIDEAIGILIAYDEGDDVTEEELSEAIWAVAGFEKDIEGLIHSLGYAALFRFLYITGGRRGEALAMTWSDIDLIGGKVKINKSVAYKIGIGNKSYQVTTPKNAGSNRTIAIPKFFCEQLKEYKEWQQEYYEHTDFVFCGADPLPPSTIERVMTTAASKANVKRIRVHDLRHSCASLLIHKGVSIVAVSRHLGHSTVEQTLNTYSHMMPDDQTMILNSLNSLSDI